MPFYAHQGQIPPKRHTTFKKADGSLYYEELVSREGFFSMYSNLYHLRRPTRVNNIGILEESKLTNSAKKHRPRHLTTSNIQSGNDALLSRTSLFFNDDVIISVSGVNNNSEFFYRNGIGDEVLYIQSGNGSLHTNLGNLEFNSGDYIVIPRGIIWQFNPSNEVRMLIVESRSPVETPSRFRNRFGQLLEHSPFCERDIKTPTLLDPID